MTTQRGKRVVVTGATGNVGTSLLQSLVRDPQIGSIVAIARRPPDLPLPKVTWARVDITRDDLVAHFSGADAVVHLAWRIQPMHDVRALAAVNIVGSRRVFDAVADAKVGALVYASSVGAYSPAAKQYTVDEMWPTNGIASSEYSWQKAYVERTLDAFELANPDVRVVRLRPALVFKRGAGREIHRLFVGPSVPSLAIPPPALATTIARLPIAFQCVHSLDVGEAYRLAVVKDVFGAFNIATDPILGRRREPTVMWRALRGAVASAFALRALRLAPGWLDLAAAAPIMDTARARSELGWTPRYDAKESLAELLGGMRDDVAFPTAALDEPVAAPTSA